eukprot:scaffold36481_cov160-Amphora_coffeaeformis.AAC.2
MKNRLIKPREHPSMTPSMAPASLTRATEARVDCAGVKLARGIPAVVKIRSKVLPNKTPEAFDTVAPNAAAVIVERPNVTPSVQSMAFPACNMIV